MCPMLNSKNIQVNNLAAKNTDFPQELVETKNRVEKSAYWAYIDQMASNTTQHNIHCNVALRTKAASKRISLKPIISKVE